MNVLSVISSISLHLKLIIIKQIDELTMYQTPFAMILFPPPSSLPAYLLSQFSFDSSDRK